MPGQDYPDHTPEAADSPVTALPSRRSVLRRGAFVGAAGLAVAAGGGGLAKALSAQSGSSSAQTAADAASSGPIVIYMADPASGEMDIFRGTGKTTHRNQAMASLVASMAPR
jgi:hypothetical protein